jgi:7-cyano-7-deazaguanine synthase in queuosine biosynthesis
MTSGHRSVRSDEASLVDTSGRLSPVASDLLALARHAFLADREKFRGRSPDDHRWHRPLEITVPVQKIGLWSAADVQDVVVRLLTWLTDDAWSVTFVRREAGEPPRQIPLPLDDTGREIALFSGGLDATAGVALQMPASPLLAVGVVTNPAMAGYQRRVMAALIQSGLGDIRYAPLPFAVVGGAKDDEPTRRTRGVVFLAAGVAAALQSDRERLLVFENGVGALNLPFTAAQSGAMTSRAVHPLTLRLMSELVELLLGRPFAIVNPYLSVTKAEMVSALPSAAREACAASESCDNAASGRGLLEKRCGYCTSCLLRRVSFEAAARACWDERPYRADTADSPKRDRLPEVLWQAATWDRALRSSDPDELRRRVPGLRQVPVDILDDSAQRRLLGAYVDEWRRYPDPLVPRYLDPAPLAG